MVVVQVFDEDDFRRRIQALEQNDDISTLQELGLLGKGALQGNIFGPLDARVQIDAAKANALFVARREMLQAIQAANDKQRGAWISIDIQEVIFGETDNLIKV